MNPMKSPHFSGIRPPMPGERDFFKCQKCGNTFTATIPLLPFFKVKCTKCGSHNVERDMRVIH
jgi:Zn finger protein HypA/HybF involved in hydrogenase expression